MKSIQIPEELFFDLCRWHLLSEPLNEYEKAELAQTIRQGLKSKLEAMQKREAYSAYKDKSKTPEEREAARQAYLDLAGIFPDWRWDSLEPPV